MEAEAEGHVVQIDQGLFSGRMREVTEGEQLDSTSFIVGDSHVHNWVVSGQLTNVNGHVEAPATPDQAMTIGGV